MLDQEQQELKRRARRRLIGSVALTLAAVVTLPVIMEHEPRTQAQDVQIRFPSQEGANFASRNILMREGDGAQAADVATQEPDAAQPGTPKTESTGKLAAATPTPMPPIQLAPQRTAPNVAEAPPMDEAPILPPSSSAMAAVQDDAKVREAQQRADAQRREEARLKQEEQRRKDEARRKDELRKKEEQRARDEEQRKQKELKEREEKRREEARKEEVRKKEEAKAKQEAEKAEKAERARAQAILAGTGFNAAASEPKGAFMLQLGTFADAENVKLLRNKLKAEGMSTSAENVGDKIRVRMGPFPSRDAAENALQKVRKLGLSGVVVGK